MKRREILNYAAVGTGTALGVATYGDHSTPTFAQGAAASSDLPVVEWRMATSWSSLLDVLFGGAQTVCDRLKAITGGRFTIQPSEASANIPARSVMDAVQAGTVECGHTRSDFYIDKNPALMFGTTIPFGLNAQQQNAWYYHDNGLNTMHRLYADFNIISFPAGNFGMQMGGWFKREFNSAADLAGTRLRMLGFGREVMEQLGVSVQQVPLGDVYLALEQGVLDGAVFIGPHDDAKLRLFETARFYYYPGWWAPGASVEVQINLDAWNRLPQQYKDALRTATYEANIDMLARYDALNSSALQRLVNNEGVQLRPYSDEILAAARRASLDVLEAKANGDATFRAIYENWKSFQAKAAAWGDMAGSRASG